MGERSTTRYAASSAETMLAIPVLYLLAGQAEAVFPHTRTASPSEKVVITRKGEMKRTPLCHFPVMVPWDQWEEAVVPVLEDGVLAVRAPLFKAALQDGRIETWVNLIGRKLRASFESAGWGG